MNKEEIEIKKRSSQFRKDAKIKQCFHFDSQSCDKIIKAHSLQENGVLSLLEHLVEGNKVVYSFGRPKVKPEFKLEGFEPLGKVIASTFSGFCQHHDISLFAEIENNGLNVKDKTHLFFMAYRAFAKEYHAKFEVGKAYKCNKHYNDLRFRERTNQMIKGNLVAQFDVQLVRTNLNKLLKTKNYNSLSHYCMTVDFFVPIACSSAITPSRSYYGKHLNKIEDLSTPLQYIMVNVIPTEKDETHIIFSFFPNDKYSVIFIDELRQLSKIKRLQAITSILIGSIENVFISPMIWESMKEKEKNILMKELRDTTPIPGLMKPSYYTIPFKSKLNLFLRKYAVSPMK